MDVTTTPWFCRHLVVWRQAANFLIEALLRQVPLQPGDRMHLNRILNRCDALIISYSRDAASANHNVVEWCWDAFLHSATANARPRLLLHSHVCCLHRLALARGRCQAIIDVLKALQSFTKWVRCGKNMQALTEGVHHFVHQDLVICRQSRPQRFLQRSEQLVDLLFKAGGDDFLHKEVRGRKVPTRFFEALQSLLTVFDLETAEERGGREPRLTHYCRRGDDDPRPCCRNRDESVAKIVGPIVNWVAGQWPEMALSRWTHVPIVLRKALLACLGPHVLVKALDYVRHAFEVDDSLESSLTRALAVSSENFGAQNKLRLLFFSRVLCQEVTPLRMSLSLVPSLTLDRIMWALLGCRRERASLVDLLTPYTSPIVKAQVDLYKLLESWEASGLWWVVALFGVNFSDATARQQALSQVLQLSTGLFDAFELRYERPPTVCWSSPWSKCRCV